MTTRLKSSLLLLSDWFDSWLLMMPIIFSPPHKQLLFHCSWQRVVWDVDQLQLLNSHLLVRIGFEIICKKILEGRYDKFLMWSTPFSFMSGMVCALTTLAFSPFSFSFAMLARFRSFFWSSFWTFYFLLWSCFWICSRSISVRTTVTLFAFLITSILSADFKTTHCDNTVASNMLRRCCAILFFCPSP